MESVVREYQLVDLEAYLGTRERPGPDEIDREITKLARRLKNWTKVEVTSTHIFKIAVRHTNPALVDTFATAVITSVVHQEQQSRQDRVEGEKLVLERQRDQFQSELNSLQSRLSRFERNLESRDLSDSEITSGNRSAARQQLSDMRSRAAAGEIGDRTQLRREAVAALPAVDQLLDELGGTPPSPRPSATSRAWNSIWRSPRPTTTRVGAAWRSSVRACWGECAKTSPTTCSGNTPT